MSQGLPSLVPFASFGTIGVILAVLTVVGSMFVLSKVSKLTTSQLLAVLGFFIVVIGLAFADELIRGPRGPWVFVGVVQGVEKRIRGDNNSVYEFFDDKSDPGRPIEYVFYVRPTEVADGERLAFELYDPQPGPGQQDRPKAWVCFSRQPNSYSERTLDSGDVILAPVGAGTSIHCEPDKPAKAAWNLVSRAKAGTELPIQLVADEPASDFTYSPSPVSGLCNWQSKTSSTNSATLVICDANALTAANPSAKELSLYIAALQNERTDTGTKIRVLQKLMNLNAEQTKTLLSLSPSAAYCDDESAYPDPKYVEPLSLTLFDLARSTDRQISGLSARAVEALGAEASFSNFIANGQCRDIWMLRLESAQAQRVVGRIKAQGVSGFDPALLDANTDDRRRTIIRPTATANGDLYQVEAQFPVDDDKTLRCLARVYRNVQMRDIAGASTDPSLLSQQQLADQEQLEYQLLKTNFKGRSRVVGWYSKIFQRDILVGAHNCGDKVTAISVQARYQ